MHWVKTAQSEYPLCEGGIIALLVHRLCSKAYMWHPRDHWPAFHPEYLGEHTLSVSALPGKYYIFGKSAVAYLWSKGCLLEGAEGPIYYEQYAISKNHLYEHELKV